MGTGFTDEPYTKKQNKNKPKINQFNIHTQNTVITQCTFNLAFRDMYITLKNIINRIFKCEFLCLKHYRQSYCFGKHKTTHNTQMLILFSKK